LIRARATIAAPLALLVALTLGISACGDDSSDDGGNTERLNVGLTFGLDAASVADKMAFDQAAEELGIEVELIETGDPAATVAGLERGDLDIGQFTVRSAIEAIQQDANLTAVVANQMVPDYVVVGDSEVQEPGDLNGARLAHHGPETDTEALAELTVERAGLGEDEVELTALEESPNRATALANGRVDAAVLESVDLQQLERQDVDVNVIAEMSDFWPKGSASGAWLVRDDLIEQDPELVADLVPIFLDTYESLYSGDGRQQWLDETGTEVLAELNDEGREELLDHLLEIGYWPRRDEPVTAESHDAAIDFWLQNGLLEEGLPFDEVWDVSAWEESAG
jgi:ABC-type nitrate/sulfonate/bicarbonate transport system substrate-binding protein